MTGVELPVAKEETPTRTLRALIKQRRAYRRYLKRAWTTQPLLPRAGWYPTASASQT
jgi:hypothetical protein